MIAIAQAVLKNAPILILDEATSAFDTCTELEIRETLWEQTGPRYWLDSGTPRQGSMSGKRIRNSKKSESTVFLT